MGPRSAIGWVIIGLACGGCDDEPKGSTGSGVGAVCTEPESRSGEATYYDFADGSGNCSFPATPEDLMVGAMNHTDYAASGACGTCVRIAGPLGEVDVRIVDRCPECPAGDIDLSPEAFSRIAEMAQGRVAIEWRYIACPVAGPVVYHFKEGSNPWWTAVQIRNHRYAVASLAYRDEQGAFLDVVRLDYNFFVEETGMGRGPYEFRVTDVHGAVVEDSGIAHVENGDVPGGGQFPECE